MAHAVLTTPSTLRDALVYRSENLPGKRPEFCSTASIIRATVLQDYHARKGNHAPKKQSANLFSSGWSRGASFRYCFLMTASLAACSTWRIPYQSISIPYILFWAEQWMSHTASSWGMFSRSRKSGWALFVLSSGLPWSHHFAYFFLQLLWPSRPLPCCSPWEIQKSNIIHNQRGSKIHDALLFHTQKIPSSLPTGPNSKESTTWGTSRYP